MHGVCSAVLSASPGRSLVSKDTDGRRHEYPHRIYYYLQKPRKKSPGVYRTWFSGPFFSGYILRNCPTDHHTTTFITTTTKLLVLWHCNNCLHCDYSNYIPCPRLYIYILRTVLPTSDRSDKYKYTRIHHEALLHPDW